MLQVLWMLQWLDNWQGGVVAFHESKIIMLSINIFDSGNVTMPCPPYCQISSQWGICNTTHTASNYSFHIWHKYSIILLLQIIDLKLLIVFLHFFMHFLLLPGLRKLQMVRRNTECKYLLCVSGTHMSWNKW